MLYMLSQVRILEQLKNIFAVKSDLGLYFAGLGGVFLPCNLFSNYIVKKVSLYFVKIKTFSSLTLLVFKRISGPLASRKQIISSEAAVVFLNKLYNHKGKNKKLEPWSSKDTLYRNNFSSVRNSDQISALQQYILKTFNGFIVAETSAWYWSDMISVLYSCQIWNFAEEIEICSFVFFSRQTRHHCPICYKNWNLQENINFNFIQIQHQI